MTNDIPSEAKTLYDDAVRILQEDMAQRRAIRGTEIVIENLREAIQIHDDYFEAWRLLGELYMGTEQPVYAYLALRKAHGLRSDDPAVAALFAEASLMLNRPELSLKYLENIEAGDDDIPEAVLKLKAMALSLAKKWDEAVDAFGQALAVSPYDGDMRRECAKILNRLEKRSIAASVLADYLDPFRSYIEKQPIILDTKWILEPGTALDHLSEGASAAAAEIETVAHPEDYRAWYELGNIFLDGEEYAASVVCFKRALRVHPDYYDALHNMGIALEEMGRQEDALQMYDAAVEANPDLPDAYLSTAELLEELAPDEIDEISLNYLMYYKLDPEAEGFEALEKRIREQLEKSPDISQILLLAQVYLLQDEIEKADSVLSLIGGGYGEAAVHWIRGRILYEREDFTGSRKAFTAGMEIVSQNNIEPQIDDEDIESRLRYDYASLLEETGNLTEAKTVLEENQDALDSEGLTLLADLLHAERPVLAEATYRNALNRDPDNIDALLGISELMVSSDRTIEALVFLEHAHAIDPENDDITGKLADLYPSIDAPELVPGSGS